MTLSDDRAVGILLTAGLCLPLTVDDKIASLISDVFDDIALSSSWEKKETGLQAGHHFLWVFDHHVDGISLAKAVSNHSQYDVSATAFIIAEVVENTNWLELSYSQFPPFSVGPFYLYGSHTTENIPPHTLPLLIDAATAFGSGEHGTTRGCLESLALLKDQNISPKKILDMGTGSGILALGAYRLWPDAHILAVDNDREATKVSCRHRRKNNVAAKNVICATGDGYNTPRVAQYGPYDLIIANILAGPLISMAKDIVAHTKPQGYIILSGLLTSQYEDVLKAHTDMGFSHHHTITHDEWVAVTLIKNQ